MSGPWSDNDRISASCTSSVAHDAQQVPDRDHADHLAANGDNPAGPLVESQFKDRALSRAGALGLWQFIASTGLRYGLSRDAWIDERMDPSAATDAAIAYLIDLHGLFGDWPKALAASSS